MNREDYILKLGDCLELMKGLPDNSIDAVITDPPYEIGFMGKSWDNTGIAYNVELWAECLRVLKSGGHLLAFSSTRTYHRMAVAIEDAGFEVRDMLEWIYASGFPKSLNVGKAVDKLQGNEREFVGMRNPHFDGGLRKNTSAPQFTTLAGGDRKQNEMQNGMIPIFKGTSAWEGLGTALKPAHEPIVMARKPLEEKTIIENVLKHGTGAIDIDGCRIPTSEIKDLYRKPTEYKDISPNVSMNTCKIRGSVTDDYLQGRYPANIICTDDALNDGVMTRGGGRVLEHDRKTRKGFVSEKALPSEAMDSGSKSRYFDIDVWGEKHGLIQIPKASSLERNEGCEGLEEKEQPHSTNMKCANCGLPVLSGTGESCKCENKVEIRNKAKNFHPTVKPVHLMSWLVRLISRKGMMVLDPFAGSGTTGIACIIQDRKFIGYELNSDYWEIANKRIDEAFYNKQFKLF